ncbi:MAG: hypothetical protein ACRCV5_21710 [Afipia sp.]
MSPAQLQQFLQANGLTLTQAGELFGVTHGAVSLWLSGQRGVPALVVKCIRLFEINPALMQAFK